MTLRACSLPTCGRDLPVDAHHLLRYCPDRDCAKQAKKKAKHRHRQATAPAVGEVRKIGRRVVVYLPDHPLRSASGWTSFKRAAMFDALGGADPLCEACARQLA